MLLWIIIFSLIGSLGAVALAGLLLVLPDGWHQRVIPHLLSYAVGSLLGAAFLELLPHALESAPALQVLGTVLAGIMLFLVLERLVLWRHCHDEHCEVHGTPGPLILFGDALHSLVDGVTIATTFMTSIPMGIATALAVASHELPKQVGDFAILLKSGYTRRRAFGLNLLAGASTVLGAILAYCFMASMKVAAPYIMGISAAGFIYIAMADLVPNLHHSRQLGQNAGQLVLILAGIGTVTVLHLYQ